jgi:hypothetical protein
VLEECGQGDPSAARSRMLALDGLPILRLSQEAIDI